MAFSSVIYGLTLPHLGKDRPNMDGTFGWLVSSDGFYSHKNNSIVIEKFGYEKFIQHVNHDYFRFTFSSVESFYDNLDAKYGAAASGWAFIKWYYAAFFAAHSLMRATGRSVIYVDFGESQEFQKLVELRGLSEVVQKGTYNVSYSYLVGGHEVVVRKRSGKAGVHEAFWSEFGAWIGQLSDKLLVLPSVDAQRLRSRLVELSSVLSHNSQQFSWLSFIRNSVNYRHGGKVWLYKQSANILDPFDYEAGYRSADTLGIFTEVEKRPTKCFQSICRFLFSLSIDLATEIKQKNSSKKSLFNGYYENIIRRVIEK
jgi:hypothetical protein